MQACVCLALRSVGCDALCWNTARWAFPWCPNPAGVRGPLLRACRRGRWDAVARVYGTSMLGSSINREAYIVLAFRLAQRSYGSDGSCCYLALPGLLHSLTASQPTAATGGFSVLGGKVQAAAVRPHQPLRLLIDFLTSAFLGGRCTQG